LTSVTIGYDEQERSVHFVEKIYDMRVAIFPQYQSACAQTPKSSGGIAKLDLVRRG
jgi:hypothetical protein